MWRRRMSATNLTSGACSVRNAARDRSAWSALLTLPGRRITVSRCRYRRIGVTMSGTAVL
jgi:hypothetical protein